MKKTLIVSCRYPLPETIGSDMRTMNFVNYFKQHGPVDIAFSNVPSGKKLGNQVFRNEFYLHKENSQESMQKRLLRWFEIKNRPFPICKYNKESVKKLRSVVESENYDYILVRYIYSTWDLMKLEEKYRLRTIVDFDDVLSGSIAESEISNIEGIHRKIMLRLNRNYLMDYERKCLDFGAALFCSEKDRLNIAGSGNDKSFVIPNIYQNQGFDNFDFGDGFANSNVLLFVGSLGYRPNVQGVLWFIESVFSDFKKKYPDAKLLIVGRSPKKEIKKLSENNPDIILYSNVPDIKLYYKQCKAVIIPLLSGGGTRIKILEAAIAKRPVISTPKGVEGLDFRNEKDLLLFSDWKEFSDNYKKLFDKEKYYSLIENARYLVLSKYSKQQFYDSMENVLKTISNNNSL